VPAKESGEKFDVLPRIASLVIVGFILWLIIWRANQIAAPFTPTPFVQPTSTYPVPGPMGIPGLDVVVSAEKANPFDIFDVKDVVIRLSNSAQVDSGSDGQFRVFPCNAEQSIYAWAPGYEIKSVLCDGKFPYHIPLPHLEAVDNPYYIWLPASADCNTCHGGQYVPNPPTASYDEMNEWYRSGHATVFEGRYFESMYKGTSATGKPSVPAHPVIIDNEWVPVPPEMKDDYHGPGFRLDFPNEVGSCAYCHVPALIQASQPSTDLYNLFPNPGGAWGEGVTCDVCHKVFDVILADDKLPLPDRPGVLSYRFLRPNNGVFTTGPFSNILTKPRDGLNLVSNHRLACSPIFSRSEFCAPCHFGKFGDMVVYNSYGEWKESSFAKDPAATGYRTCQDCHMSHMDVNYVRYLSSQRQACSANNIEFQNFDHNMMDFGMYDNPDTLNDMEIPRMVKGAADIGVTFGSQPGGTNTLDVHVTVTNKRAGHKFPTDSPLRHLILVVRVQDRVLTPLIQVGGGRIPNWAGPGPISPINIVATLERSGIKDYAGLPGKNFANLLVEEETNLSPGMAYWNETKLAFVDSANGMNSDTRLSPGKPDLSMYSFAMPDAGDVTVTVQLIYRFAFYDLVVWKEWFDPKRADIVVTAIECKGPPTQPEILGQSCRKIEP
jgi:hypothetical protein